MPQSKPIQHSFSKLSDFENCPYQYLRKYLIKDIPFEETEYTQRGNAVHIAFENRLLRKAPFTVDLGEELVPRCAEQLAKKCKGMTGPQASWMMEEVFDIWEDKYERWAQLVFAIGGKRYRELQMAIAKELVPDQNGGQWFKSTGWFDKDVWFRAIGDVFVKKDGGEEGILFDWKTGALYDKRGNEKYSPNQACANAMVAFASFPSVKKITTMFVYTDAGDKGEHRKEVFTRDDLKRIMEPLIPSLKGIKECDQQDNWPKRKSGLCKGWCPVKDCEFWEDRR